MDATAVSALLNTGFEMDGATTATAFLASRWTRQRRPAPCDASQPPWTPSLSAEPRRPVSALLDADFEMDEATTATAFRVTADAVNPAEAPCKQELVIGLLMH